MSMSKKDFIALADMVRRAEPTTDSEQLYGTFIVPGDNGDGRKAQWLLMRDRLADFCESQNPNFMRERWLDYIAGKCGPSGGSK